jgi:4,5-dihydroxyphthalate decarboxylase
MRLFLASRERAGGGATFGVEANRPAIELLMRYAAEQKLIPRPYRVDELFVAHIS